MNISIFGYIAVITSFFTLLPQIYKTFKSKQAGDISLMMWVFLLITNISWLAHGIAIVDTPLIITNIFASIADTIMIFFKLRYSKIRLK